MIQQSLCLIGILLVLLPLGQGQVDPEICPDGLTPPGQDARWSTIPDRFEIMAESVTTDPKVMEISQAFSLNRDSVVKYFKNQRTSLYWDYTTDEHFVVTSSLEDDQPGKPNCHTHPIHPDLVTSVIDEEIPYLKPSILLGFDPRNQPNPEWGIRYDSDGLLRNIPTHIFKSCFNVSDLNATVQVTYHVSDVTKFQAYLPANESLILQLDVNISTSSSNHQKYTYNVFRYTPNPSGRRERQALETPSGVYCSNRTKGKDLPSDIPDRVSSNAELFLPEFNKTILSFHNLYDTEYLFTRSDIWMADRFGGSDWQHYTEIHDYGVGLSYQYNYNTRRCRVSDINANTSDAVSVDGSPNLYQMGTSQHLFLMDDITYQYTGEKRCRDRVRCDVWIGEKNITNETADHREWYWATRFNDEILQRSIPMKLVVKRYISGVLNWTSEMSFFNYRRSPMTVFEIDYTLADCFRALGPDQNFNLGVLSFKIANDKKYPVFDHLNYLRLHIWEYLVQTLQIRPIRISNLIVDQDDKDILVTFTLLDAPPHTGPVEVPLIERSLDTLIESLRNIIDSNGLVFRAKYGEKQTLLRVRVGSLNIGHLSREEQMRSTGTLITGLWIGCVLAALLIGGVASFFIFEKLARK